MSLWNQVESGSISAQPPQQPQSAPSGNDLWSQVASGQIAGASTATTGGGVPSQQQPPQDRSVFSPIGDVIQGYAKQSLGDFAGAVGGGLRELWDLAKGESGDIAVHDLHATQEAAHSGIMAPSNAGERSGAEAADSNWNPLNWPGIALHWTGDKLEQGAKAVGAGPVLSGLIGSIPESAALVSPVLGMARKGAFKPYTMPIEEAGEPATGMASAQSISAAAADGGALPKGAPEPLGAPVEGGLPPAAQEARAATLARVGVKDARESAIQGDAKSAAVDYQMAKYDQPAGRAAAAQFQSERDALAAHNEKLIEQTGGTVGMDEDALANRGATIARPFDMLRDWFKQRTQQLYQEADAASAQGSGTAYTPGGGTSLTNLEGVDKVLGSPTFQNTLAAKGQQGLLGAVKNQLEFFRQNLPNGFMASDAEQFRQWLNSVWTPDNKYAIGQLKDAVDDDVTSHAGGDIYAQARAIRALRSTTLDNPNGISQLFDADPNTPLNRSTPLEKIPDKLTQLPIDQYANVLKTLQELPPELQPDAQAAIAEIKAHLLNKTLQAGTETSRGVGAQVWGTDRVSKVLRTNAGKFRIAFGKDPEIQQGIEDLSNAGQILKVDQSYPGADAQAANAMKRGLISRTLGHLGGTGGAAAGAWLGGPLGAAVGGGLGESAGLAAGARASEKAALKGWQKRVRPAAPQTP